MDEVQLDSDDEQREAEIFDAHANVLFDAMGSRISAQDMDSRCRKASDAGYYESGPKTKSSLAMDAEDELSTSFSSSVHNKPTPSQESSESGSLRGPRENWPP